MDTTATSMQWQHYFDTAIDCHDPRHGDAEYQAALQQQARDIAQLLTTLAPPNVLCLGAGFLNDLPLPALFQHGREVTLVDWLPQAPQRGMQLRAVVEQDGAPCCLLCDPALGPRYCRHYRAQALPASRVCSNYRPLQPGCPACAAYSPHLAPRFLHWDVTAGFATAFAQQVGRVIARARQPREALQQALQLVEHLPLRPQPLPLAPQSVTLLTSSMVLSQFDHEPLGFVQRQLQQHYPLATLQQDIDTLQGLFDKLRQRLFLRQAAAHLAEIRRLLAPQGVVYFAVELFRHGEGEAGYFMVPHMGQVLDLINRDFSFDLDALHDTLPLCRSAMGHGQSLIQRYALRLRTA